MFCTTLLSNLASVSPEIPALCISPSLQRFASAGLTPAALVAGTVAVTEASAMQTAGRALFGLTMEIAAKLLKEAKKEHYHISSLGWYFGGKNELEIHGGPQFVQKSEGVLEYSGSKLSIVDKNKRNRHS